MTTFHRTLLKLKNLNLVYCKIGIPRSYYVPPLSEKEIPKRPFEEAAGKIENKEDVWDSSNSSRYTKVRFVEGYWEFVERLKPKFQGLSGIENLKPNKTREGNLGPLEWRPSAETPPNHRYFVGRTKNDLLPVYFTVEARGPRQLTELRKIKGDIWELEKEIRSYLEAKHNNKEIDTQVNECAGFIRFKGSYLNDIKCWLYEKGF